MFGWEIKTALTSPPRCAIQGTRTRDATSPIELDPPSNKTVFVPISRAIDVPSPIANIVHVSGACVTGLCARLQARATINALVTQATARKPRRLNRNAPTTHTSAAPATVQWILPTGMLPAPISLANSTSLTCSHAKSQTSGPSGATIGGQIDPITALGYARARVTVERGVHSSVSGTA
jgi:hypothetical protein